MIPQTSEFEKVLTLTNYPSKTYYLDVENNRIVGKTDGLTAMQQAVYKILQTERYDELIYSFRYGVELKNFIGQPIAVVCARVEARIREALLCDDRVKAVKDFSYERNRESLMVYFTVETTEGNFTVEKEVRI